MSHSKRCKSHSESSDIQPHELIQTVLDSLQGKILGNAATNSPRSDELLAYPQNDLKGGGNSEPLQCMKSTIIQTSNQKDKGLEQQEEGRRRKKPQ
ncbi:hypothetical protein O181_096770 [Austropuccinia psidii MF-1]|uniref:Uncharacterized protein n=1 Tax=Austropuccinia psidii MF-1 TaxID=1389203 RepID=A0A9Q3J666_9BASI|nr:hypothetical protein [Austropuccinia psidii MF-1]